MKVGRFLLYDRYFRFGFNDNRGDLFSCATTTTRDLFAKWSEKKTTNEEELIN